VRIALALAGRITVIDAFYLQNAFLLGSGHVPYEDFVHVAFPFVEALYAPVLAATSERLVAASLATGIAVLVTALLLFRLIAPLSGRRCAFLAGALYVVAAPLLAWHLFQREVWTNVALAGAAVVLLAPPSRTGHADTTNDELNDGRAAIGGLVLAVAVLFKLTAVIGVIAILVELVLRRNLRASLIAGGALCFVFVAITLLCAARYESEFLTQAFVFFFFRGGANTTLERILAIGEHVDPVLALGIMGLALAFLRRDRRLRFAAILLAAWLAYYVLASATFWDHNAINFALPASIGAAFLIIAVVRRPRPAIIAVVLLCIAAGFRGIAPKKPLWFPHGLGGGQSVDYLKRKASFLSSQSKPGEMVYTETTFLALLAGRESIVSDFELEPVARAILREIRLRGFAEAWERRGAGALLGGTTGPDPVHVPGNLFEARVFRNTLYHTVPRLRDAIRHGELGALLFTENSPMELQLIQTLEKSGYARTVHDRVRGWSL